MAPSSPGNNSPNRFDIQRKHFGELGHWNQFFEEKMSYLANLIFCHFAFMVVLANGTPPFGKCILDVASVCSQKQMTGSDAPWIIAMMACNFFGDEISSNGKFQGNAVCPVPLSVPVEGAISITAVISSAPNPTATEFRFMLWDRPFLFHLSPEVFLVENAFAFDVAFGGTKLSFRARSVTKHDTASLACRNCVCRLSWHVLNPIKSREVWQ